MRGSLELTGMALLVGLALSACTNQRQPMAPSRPTAEHGGTDVGNAGDQRKFERNTAWFLDSQRPIQACVETTPSFPVSKARIEESVTRAFATWGDYVDKRHVLVGLTHVYHPVFSLTFRSACDDNVDLTIYAGTEGPEIALRKPYYDNPLAFAATTSPNDDGWSKGFVWLAERAPDGSPIPWTMTQLDTITLHEVGHVLGNPHNPGTIMDAAIAELIPHFAFHGLDSYRIDYSRELLPCTECHESYVADELSQRRVIALYQAIAGYPPTGTVTLTLIRSFESGWKQLTLTEEGHAPLNFDDANSALVSKRRLSISENATAFNIYDNFAVVGLASDGVSVGRFLGTARLRPLVVEIEDNLRDRKTYAREGLTTDEVMEENRPLNRHLLYLNALLDNERQISIPLVPRTK